MSIVRKMIGATDPQDAQLGTIRGDYAMHIGRNIIQWLGDPMDLTVSWHLVKKSQYGLG